MHLLSADLPALELWQDREEGLNGRNIIQSSYSGPCEREHSTNYLQEIILEIPYDITYISALVNLIPKLLRIYDTLSKTKK